MVQLKQKQMITTRSKYSRKWRKKLRVGEYRQFGFSLMAKTEDVKAEDGYDLMDKIIDIIESEKLVCGGGGGLDYVSFTMSPEGRKNNINPDKVHRVIEEVKKLKEIKEIVFTELSDVWHVTEKQSDEWDKWYEDTKVKLGIKK